MTARSMLLRPGGPLARELAQHAVVLKVNDWVFCHGGLLPHHGKVVLPFGCSYFLCNHYQFKLEQAILSSLV